MKKLVIFDLDGTLIMGAEISKESHSMARREFGLPPLSEETIERFIGMTFPQVKEALGYAPEDPQGDAYVARIEELEESMAGQVDVLYPGVCDLLEGLKKAGCLIAICSMGARSYVQSVTKAYGLDRFIDFYRWETIGMSKGDMVKSILQESGAHNAVMVGDRLFDVLAGEENNLPCIVCRYGYCDAGVELHGHSVFAPSDILSLALDLL